MVWQVENARNFRYSQISGKCTKSNSDFWKTTSSNRGFRKYMVFPSLNVQIGQTRLTFSKYSIRRVVVDNWGKNRFWSKLPKKLTILLEKVLKITKQQKNSEIENLCENHIFWPFCIFGKILVLNDFWDFTL